MNLKSCNCQRSISGRESKKLNRRMMSHKWQAMELPINKKRRHYISRISRVKKEGKSF